MDKIRYTQPSSFNEKKQALSQYYKKAIGRVPEGLSIDIVSSALLKIFSYFESNYSNVIIPSYKIPDAGQFPLHKDSYSVSEIVLLRIAKNVNKVIFAPGYKESERAMAEYKNNDKQIYVYNIPIRENANRCLGFFGARNFASNADYRKVLCEQALIHEFLHAASDNGKTIGFINAKPSAHDANKGIALNEGTTEALAIKISGLKSIYRNTSFSLPNEPAIYALNEQTPTGYWLETNLANLVRIASKDDLTLAYLIDGSQLNFGHFGKNKIYDTNQPLDFIIESMDKICNQKLTSTVIEKAQLLQSLLIKDIIDNKINDPVFRHSQRGPNATKEEYQQLVDATFTIGNAIIKTYPHGIRGSINSTALKPSDRMLELIDSGRISPTANVLEFIRMVDSVINYGHENNLNDGYSL